jgi:hypothetical protein
MKRGLLRFGVGTVIGAVVFVGVVVPGYAHAQQKPADDIGKYLNEKLFTGGYWGGISDPSHPLIPCTGIYNITQHNVSGDVNFEIAPGQVNGLPPCQSLCDIFAALQRVIYFIFTILLYVIVPVFVFVGGFKLLISGGNPGKRGEAMKTISSAVIGLVIGLGAFLIVNTFLWLIFNNNGATTNFTYTGDALSGTTSTKATRITWPGISCQPGAYNQLQPRSNTTVVAPATCAAQGGQCMTATTDSSGILSCPGLSQSLGGQACNVSGQLCCKAPGAGAGTSLDQCRKTCTDPMKQCLETTTKGQYVCQSGANNLPPNTAACQAIGGFCYNKTTSGCGSPDAQHPNVTVGGKCGNNPQTACCAPKTAPAPTGCSPACASNQTCQKQSSGASVCVSNVSNSPACAAVGGTCTTVPLGQLGCPNSGTDKGPGLCTGTGQMCCKAK